MNLTATEYKELHDKLCLPLEDKIFTLGYCIDRISEIVTGRTSLENVDILAIKRQINLAQLRAALVVASPDAYEPPGDKPSNKQYYPSEGQK